MTWLYHSDHPARIFAPDEVAAALAAGWVDSPAKIQPKARKGKK